jgi:glucose-6-phosphate 1-epimerase
LASAQYIDKVRGAKTFTEESDALVCTGETDRVYTPKEGNALVVRESNKESFVVTRDALPNVTVWNGWEDKIKGMGDFEPKDAWQRYLCIEPGSVNSWTKLEAGDAWEGSSTFQSKL